MNNKPEQPPFDSTSRKNSQILKYLLEMNESREVISSIQFFGNKIK